MPGLCPAERFKMNVLSLFDGISCGKVALDRAGIRYDKYYASEIDKYAITVTQANYPNTIQLGDVTNWREWDIDWASIDLLIGGSPCQGFSFAGKQLAFDDPRSKLFFVYVDILNHIKKHNPSVKFMFENVKMKKEYLDVISEQLGVQPVFINSALVSAQNRQRYYWANWEFGQPEDKGIVLADILEGGEVDRDKSYCIDANYHKGGNPEQYFNKARRQLVFDKPIRIGEIKGGGQGNRIYSKEGKGISIGAQSGGTVGAGNFLVNVWDNQRVKEVREDERGFRPNRGDYKKTGISEIGRIIKPTGQTDAITTSHAPKALQAVEGKNIYYRKLTPVECERLQTVPDNYTAHVSNTQRYKTLGNGWTVDVIAHILSHIK